MVHIYFIPKSRLRRKFTEIEDIELIILPVKGGTSILTNHPAENVIKKLTTVSEIKLTEISKHSWLETKQGYFDKYKS
jgi:hypothetical protein